MFIILFLGCFFHCKTIKITTCNNNTKKSFQVNKRQIEYSLQFLTLFMVGGGGLWLKFPPKIFVSRFLVKRTVTNVSNFSNSTTLHNFEKLCLLVCLMYEELNHESPPPPPTGNLQIKRQIYNIIFEYISLNLKPQNVGEIKTLFNLFNPPIFPTLRGECFFRVTKF